LGKIVFLLLIVSVTGVSGSDIYVDYFNGSDSNSGSSWSTAKRSISEGVNIAAAGDHIHVTAGYYQTPVELIPDIQIFGGYPPGGGSRNPAIHVSELNGLNSQQIMIGAQDCLLDGLVFRNGYAPAGGALKISASNMTIQSCRFIDNVSHSDDPDGGGAVFIFNSSPIFINCTFLNNRIEPSHPEPGLYLMGGAILCWSASPVFQGCLFQGNRVDHNNGEFLSLGGALFTINSTPHFLECDFHENYAFYGGALGWWNHSAGTIAGCRFFHNSAGEAGGAIASMASHDWRESRIIYSTFDSNEANSGGAIAGLQNTWISIQTSNFTENLAHDRGGAVFGFHSSIVHLENSTLNNNRLAEDTVYGGSGLFFGDKTNYRIVSNIITNGVQGEGVYLDDGEPPPEVVVRNNCVFGNAGGNYGGAIADPTGTNGNIAEDPLYVTGSGGSIYLSQTAAGQPETSPCIDTGYSMFHLNGTTRTDGISDRFPTDIGYHFMQTRSIAWLDRYFHSGGQSMNLYLLNTGDQSHSQTILYVALQIGDMFWFCVSDSGSFLLTENPRAYNEQFTLDFTKPQKILTIPFPDESLPEMTGYWHIATLDSTSQSLLDYQWTAFKLIPN
jgi:hypothetical protein